MNQTRWKLPAMSRRRLLAGTVSLAGAAGLAACRGGKAQNAAAPSPQATSSAPVRGGTVTVGLQSDIANLDPLKSSLVYDRQVQYHIYESLIATDKDLKLLPGLALSWETADPISIVFKLRGGVKFHDGSDFNAEAVKLNIDRILQTASSPRSSEISGVQSPEVVDPSTLKLSLKAPFSPLLAQLVDRSGMIVSPTAIQKLGDDLTHNPAGAGTGPFTFVEYKSADHVTLARNEAYWRKDASGAALPYLAKLQYRPLADETQRLNSLRAGEIDFADTVPTKDVASVKSDPTLSYIPLPALSFNGFYVNASQDPFTDIRVRQALAWAIDRQQIVDTVYSKVYLVSNGPIAPPQFPYDPSYKPYTRDVTKAKTLLGQAGRSGVTFTLFAQAGSNETQQLAELIKDQVKDAGFTVNIQQIDFPTIVANMGKHQFQAAISGWSGRLDPDGNTYIQFHTGGGNNYGQYTNPAMDKALEAARQSFDEAQRKPLYQQVNRLAAEEVPYVFTHHQVTGQFSTVKLRNFTPVPDAIYRFAEVWKQS